MSHRLHAGNYEAKDNVFIVKECCLRRADEELRPVCVWTSIGHGQCALKVFGKVKIYSCTTE